MNPPDGMTWTTHPPCPPAADELAAGPVFRTVALHEQHEQAPRRDAQSHVTSVALPPHPQHPHAPLAAPPHAHVDGALHRQWPAGHVHDEAAARPWHPHDDDDDDEVDGQGHVDWRQLDWAALQRQADWADGHGHADWTNDEQRQPDWAALHRHPAWTTAGHAHPRVAVLALHEQHAHWPLAQVHAAACAFPPHAQQPHAVDDEPEELHAHADLVLVALQLQQVHWPFWHEQAAICAFPPHAQQLHDEDAADDELQPHLLVAADLALQSQHWHWPLAHVHLVLPASPAHAQQRHDEPELEDAGVEHPHLLDSATAFFLPPQHDFFPPAVGEVARGAG
ncbi:hypothetical protein GGF31_001674 [Allomyces arbusculus]|nr:hypothetical protein GGF31_001674 [Allomyces arbusculus]